MAAKLITASSNYPVSLAEAQAHCVAPEADFETLLEIYRKAACEDAEKFTGRALIDQTWDFYLDEFPADGSVIKIPKPPLIEVIGIYLNGAGDPIDAAGYVVDAVSELARISLPSAGAWPTITAQANAVRIRFRAGYVDEDVSPVSGAVPFAIKAAILLTTGTLFANRETVVIGQTATMMPWAAEQLLRPYRVHTAMA